MAAAEEAAAATATCGCEVCCASDSAVNDGAAEVAVKEFELDALVAPLRAGWAACCAAFGPLLGALRERLVASLLAMMLLLSAVPDDGTGAV